MQDSRRFQAPALVALLGGTLAAGAQVKKLKIVAIMPALDNQAYIGLANGIKAEAKKHKNANVTVLATADRSTPEALISQIEDAAAKKADAIIVDGSDDTPLLPALRKVVKNKIPLILVDAPAPTLKGYTAYIGADNQTMGRLDGVWLRKKLPNGGKIGILTCVPGHPVTEARISGFKQGLTNGGQLSSKFNFVAELNANCDRNQGLSVMSDMITAHPDLNAVFSTSDTQTLGAIQALKNSPNLLVVSFDAQPEAVQDIASGNVLDASVSLCVGWMGSHAVKTAIAAAQHKHVQNQIAAASTVVDATNAKTWKSC